MKYCIRGEVVVAVSGQQNLFMGKMGVWCLSERGCQYLKSYTPRTIVGTGGR